MEIIILKYTSFSKGNEVTSFYTKEIGQQYKTYENLSFLNENQNSTIISFDYVNIIKDIPLFEDSVYIDIENLKKQLVGRSKIDYKRKSRPWIIWNMIEKLNPNDLGLSIDEFKRNLNNSKAIFLGINSDNPSIDTLLVFFLNCLESIYLNLKEELLITHEKDRFERIESKINNVLFEAHKKGIKIDTIEVKKHIENINIALYKVKNELQLEYGIFSLYDYENIKNNLSKQFNWFRKIKVNSKEFWKAIKLRRSDSRLVELLYLERKLTKNKTILTRIGSLDDKYIFPSFDYFGTITGRILVYSPSLQQLNRAYRNVLIPEEGKEFIYVDYSQFEAGILAHEANDQKLIQMYNDNDIYTEISNKLGEAVSRDLAKKMFFSYCYGMSKENLLKYSGHNLNIFFNEFASLKTFEDQVLIDFQTNGYVETILGNRRHKSFKNYDNKKERWLISQRIQGTASLILKDVILTIYNKSKEIEFILPMHDAVLYQVPKNTIDANTAIIIQAFEEGLKKYCQNLIPKALNQKFTE